jgi:hypothetical protein
MKKQGIFLALLIALLGGTASAQFNLDKLKKETSKIKPAKNTLSNDDIIKGLKEALNVGTNNSTASASKVNGYFRNPKITIPFPKDAAKVEKALRQAGLGKMVDDFTLTLNRAAEEAAKEAAPIFIDAIKGMSIRDGLSILQGNETAATSYLKTNTQDPLKAKFQPVVERALQKTQATKYWSNIITAYNRLPTTLNKINPNLSDYATTKAIDGLFVLVGEEEAKIRKDPAARISDILQRVFGKK